MESVDPRLEIVTKALAELLACDLNNHSEYITCHIHATIALLKATEAPMLIAGEPKLFWEEWSEGLGSRALLELACKRIADSMGHPEGWDSTNKTT